MAPLNAQIEQVRGTLAELECEMRAAEAELETFSADRLRFDALRDACTVLERLDALDPAKYRCLSLRTTGAGYRDGFSVRGTGVG